MWRHHYKATSRVILQTWIDNDAFELKVLTYGTRPAVDGNGHHQEIQQCLPSETTNFIISLRKGLKRWIFTFKENNKVIKSYIYRTQFLIFLFSINVFIKEENNIFLLFFIVCTIIIAFTFDFLLLFTVRKNKNHYKLSDIW